MVDQNQSRCPGATIVCEACIILRSRGAAVPGRGAGKCSRCGGSGKEPGASKGAKPVDGVRPGDVCPKCDGGGQNSAGGNFRNFTHVLEETTDGTHYANWSKGEKPQILAFLRRPKRGVWCAAIADSGQKNVAPYTPINTSSGRGGSVMIDETPVELPDTEEGWRIVDDASALLTAGGTKEGLETGQYTDGSWSRCADQILAFEQNHGHLRGGAWFGLAVWLAQADQAAVEARLTREKEERAKKKAAAKDTSKKPKKEKQKDEHRGGAHRAEAPDEHDRREGQGEVADAHGGATPRPADSVPAEPGRERAQGAGDPPEPSGSRAAHVPEPGGVGHARRVEPRDPGVGQLRLPGFA